MYTFERNEGLEEPLSHATSIDNMTLSDSERDYVKEAVETRNEDLIVARVDELQDAHPPKAIDSDSQYRDLLGDSLENIDNRYLEAPNDQIQVETISDAIAKLPGIHFDEWKDLSFEGKQKLLQQIENVAADTSHRSACDILVKPMEHNCYGYFDPKTKTIVLNSNYLGNDYDSYHNALDTVIHEGRHAYQDYNVNIRQVHNSQGDCTNWQQNLGNSFFGLFPENYGYQDAATYGFERYWMQPVEADARAFAEDVLTVLNKKI